MRNPFKKPRNGEVYFDVLKYLSHYGIGNPANVFPTFKNFERKPHDKYADRGFIRKELITNFLEGMDKNGHIRFLDLNLESDKEYVCKEWDYEYKIEASITQEGFLFLYEKRKIDHQFVLNWLTLIFIAVTAIIGGFNYYLSNKTFKVTEKYDSYAVDSVKLNSLLRQESKHILKLQQDSILLHRLLNK